MQRRQPPPPPPPQQTPGSSAVRCALLTAVFSMLLSTFEASAAASAKTGPTHDKIVVCYISTWAVYRPGRGAYSIQNFDANLCTNVVYAFAGLDDKKSAIKSLDPWQDLKDNYGKGGYEHLTELKHTYPHLKVTLAIGGWNEGSQNYSLMAENATLRSGFVKQAASFVRKYQFDGLDLDWEYPTQRDGRPHDRENFVALARELREEFDKHDLLLTSAIGAAKHVIDQAYDLLEISKYLHYLHIMCYDYHGSWENKIGYNSPLQAKQEQADELTVEYTINYLLEHGAPAAQLVLGLPFYGRTFITKENGSIGDSTLEGRGFQGPFTRENGFLGYNEICALTSNKSSGWTTAWHPETSQAVAYSRRDPQSNELHVVTYDNSRSIANKVKFAIAKELGGLMVWSVDTDDFLGECKPEEDTYADFKFVNSHAPRRLNNSYPLLRTINEAITLAIEDLAYEESENTKEMDNEITDERNVEVDITSGATTRHFAFGVGFFSMLNLLLLL